MAAEPRCPGCDRTIPDEVVQQALLHHKDLRCKCGSLRRWQSLLPGDAIEPTLQPLPRPEDSGTIAEARAYIQSRLDGGVLCPCCGKNNKRYTRILDAGIARGLVALVRSSPKGEIVHVKDIPEMLVGDEVWTAHDFAKARFWGLCEEVPPSQIPKDLLENAARKRRKGFWRSTEKGRKFVYSMLTVPRYISLVNNKFERCHGDEWSIQDALGHPFDFYEVTGVPRPTNT